MPIITAYCRNPQNAPMLDSSINEIIQSALLEQYQIVLIEAMGLFWILAEYWILFWIRAGRKALSEFDRPHSELSSRPLLIHTAIFVTVSIAILSRHFLGEQYPSVLATALSQRSDSNLAQAIQAHLSAQRTHYALWSAFVTIWIALETLIVYNGLQGYRRLRALLPEAASPAPPNPGPLLAMFALAAAAALLPCAAAWPDEPDMPSLLHILDEARNANATYRNAMYLYLRLAGIVWIAVEWIAAIILWNCYRMLTRIMQKENARSALHD